MQPLLLLLALAVLAVPAPATEPALEDWDVSRYEWTGELGDGMSVAIVNLHGDLRVRAGAEGEVYLLAVIQRHKDDPRQPAIVPEASPGELRLEVRYPDPQPAGGAPPDIPETWTRRRVDLTVFVPPGARTAARTSDGLVELKGLAGEVTATSERGDVTVRITGPLKAYTRHGGVFAQLRRTDWQGTSEIETLTGEIRVELPRGGRAEVELETRGEITTDYSIEIRRQDNGQLKLGSARIGDGGGRLVLRSHRGAIRLIESLVPEQKLPADQPTEPPSAQTATPIPNPTKE